MKMRKILNNLLRFCCHWIIFLVVSGHLHWWRGRVGSPHLSITARTQERKSQWRSWIMFSCSHQITVEELVLIWSVVGWGVAAHRNACIQERGSQLLTSKWVFRARAVSPGVEFGLTAMTATTATASLETCLIYPAKSRDIHAYVTTQKSHFSVARHFRYIAPSPNRFVPGSVHNSGNGQGIF